jgi:NADP-dependent 3-hydroxy acid dehydrogenase YdfG
VRARTSDTTASAFIRAGGAPSTISGRLEARAKLGEKDIKVGNIEPGLTGSDMQLPEIPPEKQREMIESANMLRAEDIAVATHFMLTQPRRTVVSLMRVEPRVTG